MGWSAIQQDDRKGWWNKIVPRARRGTPNSVGKHRALRPSLASVLCAGQAIYHSPQSSSLVQNSHQASSACLKIKALEVNPKLVRTSSTMRDGAMITPSASCPLNQLSSSSDLCGGHPKKTTRSERVWILRSIKVIWYYSTRILI
ncbi:hypothetical protein M413DRAFT_264592 [Hebeloma cylindrosporum]|uniref:Uncharacterized protein n=1 Tax=Hebeloma cylindrosporum TaxID=76867 RepID=A0A0C3CSH1_HEBCY|nr:hypothetical protein M413DRAFT_264592 [Hebeloma cylindrosporum h7]